MNLPLIKWMSEEGQADEYLTTLDWNKFEWPDFSMEEKERIARYHATFFKTKTNAELFDGAKERNAVIEPVHTIRDILEHPQLEAREYWQELEHPELGAKVTYPGGFCRLSDTFCKQWRRAPLIGEHNMEIYQKEMGFSKEKLVHLKQAGII